MSAKHTVSKIDFPFLHLLAQRDRCDRRNFKSRKSVEDEMFALFEQEFGVTVSSGFKFRFTNSLRQYDAAANGEARKAVKWEMLKLAQKLQPSKRKKPGRNRVAVKSRVKEMCGLDDKELDKICMEYANPRIKAALDERHRLHNKHLGDGKSSEFMKAFYEDTQRMVKPKSEGGRWTDEEWMEGAKSRVRELQIAALKNDALKPFVEYLEKDYSGVSKSEVSRKDSTSTDSYWGKMLDDWDAVLYMQNAEYETDFEIDKTYALKYMKIAGCDRRDGHSKSTLSRGQG